MYRMYNELAPWWPLLSDPAEYEEEATFYGRTLGAAGRRPMHSLLELGSGGGNNASHLKALAAMTLVEPSAAMLAVSQALNPECEHVQGDMRAVRLGRVFDAVFVHDAVCYMTSETDLRRAIETAFLHCAPGGAVLFAPDYVRETFTPSTDHGGHDHGTRGLRYLEWTWDPDPHDTTYTVDYALMIRDRDGTARVIHDRHTEGLFSRNEWLRWLTEAGFAEASAVPFDHSDAEPGTLEVFVARRDTV